MSRVWWRLLAYLVLLPPLALAFLPFTGGGSRLLLDNVNRLLPLEVEYGGGTLAGELTLKRLAWHSEDLRLELSDALLELSPNCLWHSRICFAQLNARQMVLAILPGAQAEPDDPVPDVQQAPLEFPVSLEAHSLQLDALSVSWEGGEWRQGRMEGAVSITGSTIKVARALVQDARLVLIASDDDGTPNQLPQLSLPLDLQVEELVLDRPGMDLYGEPQAFDMLRLDGGEWQGTNLHLGRLQLRSADLGHWQATADLDFTGGWPLAVTGDGQLPAIAGWPAVLASTLSFSASGNPAALALQVRIAGDLALVANASLDALDPALPYHLVFDADWPGTLALSGLVDVPEALAGLTLTAPLQLGSSGTVDQQVFQLTGKANAPDYGALDVRLAGSHQGGRIVVEDLRMGDAGGANTLWGVGELEYTGPVRWSAALESSGLDLLPLSEYGAGRIKGQLQLLGEFAQEGWQLSLVDADLSGTLNGLPVRVSGYAGIDSQLRLLPAELRAEVNGTRLQLTANGDDALPGRLDIELDDLGLWLAGSRGKLAVHASLAPGWEEFKATGSLRDVEWQDLRVGSGKLVGDYRAAGPGNIALELTLAELAMGAVELDSATLSLRGNTQAQTISLHTMGDVDGLLEIEGASGADATWAGRLAATTLQTADGKWYLAEPVTVDFAPSPSRLKLAAHCWQFGQGRVCPGETVLGEAGSTSLTLEGELATLAAFLPPNLELQGTVTGQMSAAWAPERPMKIEAEASARDILFVRHFGEGESGSMSWQKVEARVSNGADGLSLAAGVYSADLRIIDLKLLLPADRSKTLSGELAINRLQLASLAPFAPTMSVLEGEVRGQLQLQGSLDQPLAEGALYLSAGHFALLGNPTELQQLELELAAHGDAAILKGSGALGGGRLQLSGMLHSEPEWRLDLTLAGERHEILLPPYTQMLVSENLDMILTGGLLNLEGEIVVHEGTLEHEQLPEGGVTLSDDVVEVDLVGNVIYEAAPFDIRMNVGLLIEDNFRILGDMVNATVGGDLQLRQEPRQPLQVFGNLNVLGGELRAYQQRLRIQRGTVSFAGTPENPELDVRAQREISGDNVVVGLQLQGTLMQPKLEVFSDPVMSHGETMSYLVRGRGLDSGAGADGVAMALSVGTGLVNQSAVVTELNRIPGVSNISFGAEGSTEEDTAATVGGYIGERLYLSYGMGIYEPINVLTARLYLQTRLWLEVVSRLENSVDLYYSFDIK